MAPDTQCSMCNRYQSSDSMSSYCWFCKSALPGAEPTPPPVLRLEDTYAAITKRNAAHADRLERRHTLREQVNGAVTLEELGLLSAKAGGRMLSANARRAERDDLRERAATAAKVVREKAKGS